MKIEQVIFPVIVEDFTRYEATVAHYREVLALPLLARFENEGYVVSYLGPMVVLGAPEVAALAVARTVRAILVVDDLAAAYASVAPTTETVVAIEAVPSGGRFVVRHPSGHVVEYLDLAAYR